MPVDLAPLFRSPLLLDLLHLLLVEGGQWTAEDLSSRAGAPYPTVTKEVRRLERSGLLTTVVVGRTKLLAADRTEPSMRALTRALALADESKGGDMAKKKKDSKKKKDGKKGKKK